MVMIFRPVIVDAQVKADKVPQAVPQVVSSDLPGLKSNPDEKLADTTNPKIEPKQANNDTDNEALVRHNQTKEEVEENTTDSSSDILTTTSEPLLDTSIHPQSKASEDNLGLNLIDKSDSSSAEVTTEDNNHETSTVDMEDASTEPPSNDDGISVTSTYILEDHKFDSQSKLVEHGRNDPQGEQAEADLTTTTSRIETTQTTTQTITTITTTQTPTSTTTTQTSSTLLPSHGTTQSPEPSSTKAASTNPIPLSRDVTTTSSTTTTAATTTTETTTTTTTTEAPPQEPEQQNNQPENRSVLERISDFFTGVTTDGLFKPIVLTG